VLYDDVADGRQQYSVEFGTETLQKGVYFSVLSTGNERKVLKLIELK